MTSPEGGGAAPDSDSPGATTPADKKGLPLVNPDLIEQEVGVDIDNIVPTYGYQQLATHAAVAIVKLRIAGGT